MIKWSITFGVSVYTSKLS